MANLSINIDHPEIREAADALANKVIAHCPLGTPAPALALAAVMSAHNAFQLAYGGMKPDDQLLMISTVTGNLVRGLTEHSLCCTDAPQNVHFMVSLTILEKLQEMQVRHLAEIMAQAGNITRPATTSQPKAS